MIQKGGGATVAWKFNEREAVFAQIANRLRWDIFSGKYLPDEQIPSVRQIASEASVNPNTVQRALYHLEEEGLLYTKGTVGRFVTSDTELITASKERSQKQLVKQLLYEAESVGITVEELIKYINEEDKAR